jgi:hypothetical protein
VAVPRDHVAGFQVSEVVESYAAHRGEPLVQVRVTPSQG